MCVYSYVCVCVFFLILFIYILIFVSSCCLLLVRPLLCFLLLLYRMLPSISIHL